MSNVLIRVFDTPHDEDDGFPWDFNEDTFLDWYVKVLTEKHHLEGVPKTTVKEAIKALEKRGYSISDPIAFYRQRFIVEVVGTEPIHANPDDIYHLYDRCTDDWHRSKITEESTVQLPYHEAQEVLRSYNAAPDYLDPTE